MIKRQPLQYPAQASKQVKEKVRELHQTYLKSVLAMEQAMLKKHNKLQEQYNKKVEKLGAAV